MAKGPKTQVAPAPEKAPILAPNEAFLRMLGIFGASDREARQALKKFKASKLKLAH